MSSKLKGSVGLEFGLKGLEGWFHYYYRGLREGWTAIREYLLRVLRYCTGVQLWNPPRWFEIYIAQKVRAPFTKISVT